MVKVQVKQGVLIGGKAKTSNDFEFYEFLQIPYAEPPVGNLRFKSPLPPKPWNGERDASSENKKQVAPQINLANQMEGSEDCLYLNVYTPHLPTKNSKLLPVIVFIHGGGFILGKGTIKNYLGVDIYVERNVISVSINYRLGVFGFLSLDIPEAAGNMGLKDQVAALKWVQDNIAVFGGDKANVTIQGVSAGAASVEYHMLSESSKGLFSKGIAQSGSSLNHWAYQHNIRQFGLQLAQNLGYKGSISDMARVHEYLMQQPIQPMLEETNNLEKQFKGGINLIFVPSVEMDFGNGEAFLTRLPYQLLKEGKFNKVPIIRGFTENEGTFTQSIKPEIIKMLLEEKNFTNFWKYTLNVKYNSQFEQQYFNEKLSPGDKKWGAIDFIGDYDFTSGIITSSKLIADQGIPVYNYIFAFDGISLFKTLFNIEKKGAGHVDDLFYFQDFEVPGVEFKLTSRDYLMRRRMVKLLTNFAKTGNPTPDCGDDDLPLQWPAFTSEDEVYMVIDETMRLKTGHYPERISIFEEIYNTYHK